MNYGNGEEILNFLYSVKIFAGDWKTTKKSFMPGFE
jgi:hypothetical protein